MPKIPLVVNKMNNRTITSSMVQTSVFLILLIIGCIRGVESCRGGSLISTGVTQADRNEILEAHNKLRQKVAQGQVPGQPGAQNMREMVWDEELAIKAQQWANECTFEHDPSRYLDRFTMGQNLAIMWSTAPLGPTEGSFSSRIQNWFNEVRKYAWGAGWSPKTGHYSQLVWGETNLVGCGFAYYQDSRRFNKLYVCNYGPGGNVVGAAPYAVGAPSCSTHGMNPSSKYSGLCVNTQTIYTSNNDIITQNTYTFKSEHINPTVYRIKTTSNTQFSQPNNYLQPKQYSAPKQYTPPQQYLVQQPYSPPQQKYSPPQNDRTSAIETYQQALNAYQNPNQSYESAQQNYQLALQAYSAAYPRTPQQTTKSPYVAPTRRTIPSANDYDWNMYFG